MLRGIKYSTIKNLLDYFFILPLMIIALPVVLIILFICLIQLKQVPLFSQERSLSLYSKKIKIYKVRTLKHTTPVKCCDIFYKPEYTNKVDPFSAWLRKSGLDELPQLFNVLKGEMSLIGPRPLDIHDLTILKENFPDAHECRERLNIKPGITGLWQTYGNRASGVKDLIELDTYYEKSACLKLDFKIILRTMFILIFAGKSDSVPDRNSGIKIIFPDKRIYNLRGEAINKMEPDLMKPYLQ